MTPDELIKKAETELGLSISRATLLRYEKAELIPLPERGADGRGYGRYTNYSNNALLELYASWVMLKMDKIHITDVAKARKEALDFEQKKRNDYLKYQPPPYSPLPLFNYKKALEDNQSFIKRITIEKKHWKAFEPNENARKWLQYKILADGMINWLKIEPMFYQIFDVNAFCVDDYIEYFQKILKGLEGLKKLGVDLHVNLAILLDMAKKNPELSIVIHNYLYKVFSPIPKEVISFIINDSVGIRHCSLEETET